MMNRIRWASLGLVFGAAVALAVPTFAQQPSSAASEPTAHTITVSGMGIVRSAPDEAVLWIGVQTQSGSANQALRDNAAKMTKVIDGIVRTGVRRDDIATSSVSLNPNYDTTGQRVTGFTAANQVTVTVRDLSRVGDVIDRAVAAGANLTSGVTFQLSERNQGVNQALAQAVQDARSKAEALASAAGAHLGTVVSVTETSAGAQPPVYYAPAADAGGGSAAPTPIAPGQVETQVSVTVVWELSA
jgi:uncharacterized protein YggE